MRRLLFTAATLLATTPAIAAPAVLGSRFEVDLSYAGTHFVAKGDQVPQVVGDACYDWYLRLDDKAGLAVTERLELPEAIDWGDVATDPDDDVDILDGGKVSQSLLTLVPDADGWIHSGWCVASGDPLGHYRFVVSSGGALLGNFDFDVVAPDRYRWPAPVQPAPFERTVHRSW